MADTYTVQKGDTLSEIAQKFLSSSGYSSIYGSNGYLNYLTNINNIKDSNYIVVGQTIKLSGEATATTTNTTSRATINVFGLQSNTDRTMYVTWTWSKDNTANYQVIWYYDTGDNVWFIGNDTKVEDTQSIYTAPSNALKVKVKVKPISKTYTVNKTETSYWTAGWSTEKTYSFSDNPPTTPSTPTVTIKNFSLTAELDNLDVNGTQIEFQVVKDDSFICSTGKSTIQTSRATYNCTVAAGSVYKVRCRAVRGELYSDWSDYSNNVGTIPSAPSGITICRASSATSVYIEWEVVINATSYDLEYTTNKNYFDGSDSTTTVSGIEFTHYEKTGLTSGDEYFFRVRAVNDEGHSAWTEIKSVVIGKPPAAPTTWSSTTTAITGNNLTLYWVHNSEDASKETFAELEIIANGLAETHTIKNESAEDDDEDDEEKTSFYVVDTSEYVEGTKIYWRVRTSGITNELGDWSTQRTIDIYSPPTLDLRVTDYKGSALGFLESFPINISAVAGPNTQVPIGYHLVVTATESYETVDNIGNVKYVNQGDAVYSNYFDISRALTTTLSASNISLENNVRYEITCTVSMDSGLTATNSYDFTVAWTEEEFEPNAEIGINKETYTAYIRPFCKDGYGRLINGVTLAVYRREFDGKFTELAKDLVNTKNTFITDPHPALDFARYRVVATTDDTGTVSYCDIAGYPVGCTSVIIQWDEEWSGFDVTEETAMSQRPWSGSLLELPYNIDVSDMYNPDIALIEYIGREYPVSYYGTQLGMTSTWTTTIPKNDKETIYALRRLARWMGDVYVREPSGSGYWANITVTFPQKHLETTITVTLNITRVAGGT